MRKMIFLLVLVSLYSCQDIQKSKGADDMENSLFSKTFRDYREIGILSDYKKISDTLIFTGGSTDDYRLLELGEDNDHLVIFYKVVDRDSIDVNDLVYRVLDTLQINDLKEGEQISIGYCFNEAFYEGEIIGLVEKTDSLQVQRIVKAWRANPATGSVEEVEEFREITCLNENYSNNGKQTSLKHLDLGSRIE